ncbi:MAG: plasmid pRiA4b ORF-3 family protein [Clostridiales bacterium]|jgi:hypothetical protein|nr:plasmid pRiA4b ORF-3 family protein [Clostridiales bacterium]
MILHITKKLADKLKLLPTVELVKDGLHSWRANYVNEDGYCFVVIMNDASRFTVVINEAKAEKLKKLPELFIQTLCNTLLSFNVNPEVIDRYIEEIGEITYSKNSDRKKTTQLTKNTNDTWWALRDLSDDVELSVYVNRMIYNTSGTDEVFVPVEKMLELLSKYGLPVRKCHAFDLEVRLDLDGNDAVRKLRVPANLSFEQLHKLLQTAFGWLDHHLYSFGMFKKWSDDYYAFPDLELALGEDCSDGNPDAIIMKGWKLSDYIPEYRNILYKYDFGDEWHHYIRVENIIEDCGDDLPLLLSGAGNAPPEDVGGSGGFAEFLDIIADPSHSMHTYMTEWAKSQHWKTFNFNAIARRVNPIHAYINDMKKVKTAVTDGVIAEAALKPLGKARHILEYMKRHPDFWGTVIATMPQGRCDNCGEPARIIVDDYNGNEIGKLCDECYNSMMADFTGSDVPAIIPKQLSVKGRNGKPIGFEIEFLVFANGNKSLTATEIGKRKRRADVYGKIEDDFNTMLETLKYRIKKALAARYMEKDGYISGSKAVGYIEYNPDFDVYNIIIDGTPYSWDELEKNIFSREGWKIKIEFASTGDELD